jgi:hypothetical protein
LQVEDFYDLADQYGIMVWAESIFACAHYPTAQEFLSNVAAETTQQVTGVQHLQRLQTLQASTWGSVSEMHSGLQWQCM